MENKKNSPKLQANKTASTSKLSLLSLEELTLEELTLEELNQVSGGSGPTFTARNSAIVF